ncbi:class I SAM-dependent methyltransferase [Bradyrhizobium sp. sGM-13]|uniref:class I SAM-dependent methyltransferase n=1 Tax=Bradyrhizobium sp. sGM-13 TaxID=2831781 RepID=UPI001BCAE389|nr:class I SAM-dependent methyltransferase [Bradyrhizobium sp. sGM-13]
MNEVAIQSAVCWGDFSLNAAAYGQNPPYSHVVLSSLLRTVRAQFDAVRIVELGAGTGNLLRSFIDKDIHGFAVEPNKEMRAVARSLAPDDTRFEWIEGTAEEANLPPRSANWVLLGNAYQFVQPAAMFKETSRILVPGGFLTIIWNVRHFKRDALQRSIEEKVKRMAGNLKRTGSSVAALMENVDTNGQFNEYMYMEASHKQVFSSERLLASWNAGHDIPSQVSAEMWQHVVSEIARMIPKQDSIETTWLTRAWTFQAA